MSETGFLLPPGEKSGGRPRCARPGRELVVRLALGAALVLGPGAGCATAPTHGPSAPFAVSGNVPDASVWIDDRMVGTVSELVRAPRRIAVGFHRVEIRAPGYEPHYQELEVSPNAPQVVRFELHEVLP